MKKVAIMQPYFFPYIGYFQLINAVDTFVFYDDVDFIKNGWISRNKILINGEFSYLTIPCKNISSNKPINAIEHDLNDSYRKKLKKKILFTYKKAPFFEFVYPIFEQTLSKETSSICDLAIESIVKTSEYLNLQCSFKISSEIDYNKSASTADRLIELTSILNAQNYINSLGGQELYDKKYFEKHGLKLEFLEPGIDEYNQFNDIFVPNLSIIDVMMFNSSDLIREYLKNYKIH